MHSFTQYWGLFNFLKSDILKMWLRFTPSMAKLFTTGDCSMGYIHCCGALHKTKTFMLAPKDKFVLCELDYLSKCPICGHTVVQLTRIDKYDDISVIRRINKKAQDFYDSLRNQILCEIRPINYNNVSTGRFYLNYNEFGVKKRCYSNFRTLKIGLAENKYLKINPQ